MQDLFNFYTFLYPVKRLIDIYYKNKNSIKGNLITPLTTIKEEGITKLLQVNNDFTFQIKELSVDITNPEDNIIIQERIKKALEYFIKHAETYIKIPLDELTFATENKEVDKDIQKQLNQMEELVTNKLYCLNGLIEGFSTIKYLEIRAKAVLQKSKVPAVKKEYADTTEHPVLFSKLRKLRSVFAENEDVPHFQIFTQKSLYGMCELFPVTTKQLRAINGMGKIRVQKYGQDILEIIIEYCANNTIEPKEDTPEKIKPKKGNTQEISLKLFKNGLTVSDIATERGLAKGTIEGHLAKFIPTGDIKITELIPEDKYLELKKIMTTIKFDSLSELKNKIDDKFSYNDIRLVARDIER
ncbi:DNA repair and recombination protein, putative helicase [hydrothermal vent metagenome]|uniref:DNA repair and recombination protein, putative helicase n=1 Tax=hydrothermal vent metagenome TaxID=652676 RepID=A0A3B0R0H0_9ZZZZ